MAQQAYVSALLGVYELNRVDLLRDVFVWAYERSWQYVAIQQILVPPDEHAHFTALVLAEFETLHAGNAVRFGIRPLEYSAWVGR